MSGKSFHAPSSSPGSASTNPDAMTSAGPGLALSVSRPDAPAATSVESADRQPKSQPARLSTQLRLRQRPLDGPEPSGPKPKGRSQDRSPADGKPGPSSRRSGKGSSSLSSSSSSLKLAHQALDTIGDQTPARGIQGFLGISFEPGELRRHGPLSPSVRPCGSGSDHSGPPPDQGIRLVISGLEELADTRGVGSWCPEGDIKIVRSLSGDSGLLDGKE